MRNLVRRWQRLWSSTRLRFATTSVTDQVLISGSNLILNIVVARWLSKNAYGSFSVMFSAFVLFSGFFSAFLIEPLSVFGPVRFRHCVRSYTARVVELHAMACLAVAPAVGVFLFWTAPAGVSIWESTIAVNVCLALVLLYWLLRRVMYVTSEYGSAVVASTVYNGSLLITIAALQLLGLLSAASGLSSQAVAAFCAAAVIGRTLHGRSDPSSPVIQVKHVAAQHWEYGRWALGTAIVYWLSAEAYYVIVGKVVNATAVAGFRSVQNLSMLFPNFATAMSVLVLPKLSVRFAEAGGKAIRRPVLMFTVASALGAIVYAGSILIVGAPLLSTVYGNGYIEYVGLFPLLCLNLVLITISQGVQVGLRAMNAPREVFFGFLIAGLFTCTAGIAMTYRWQLNGAVAGLCCSTLLFLLFVTYRYQFLVRHRAVAARTHP